MFGKKTWHQHHSDSLNFGQRIADRVASRMGSWRFIIYQSFIVAVYITLNFIGFARHWDPYPFILLSLLFSAQAAYAAPVIMMAQNRQSERDRIQAQADYDTNVKAKMEIENLQLQLNTIELEKLDRIIRLLEEMKENKIK
ncbi:MAG TPA: DUF1003 domain-containing protein [Chitinophagaceae bacterium]|nr:DUF1003 domain-containing protein [Chitinophagaceae bacterium]